MHGKLLYINHITICFEQWWFGLHLFHCHQHYTSQKGQKISVVGRIMIPCSWILKLVILWVFPSLLNFRCSDMLEYMFSWSLCSVFSEWVEIRLPSRFLMFPFRKHVCFKKVGNLFLNSYTSRSDVEHEIGFPQFWFILLISFCSNVSIMCNCLHFFMSI